MSPQPCLVSPNELVVLDDANSITNSAYEILGEQQQVWSDSWLTANFATSVTTGVATATPISFTVQFGTSDNWVAAGTAVFTNDWQEIIGEAGGVVFRQGRPTNAIRTRLARSHPAIVAKTPRMNHHGKPMRSFFKDAQFASANPSELVALQLLRQMVDADVFRKYLRHGFVTVRGPSGMVYQIGRDYHERVIVRNRGQKIASLCVHLKDSKIPLTDAVVAKMLIVECDEPDIWKRANVTWHADRPDIAWLPQKALGGNGAIEIIGDGNIMQLANMR